jgi:hypothetical protein
MQKLIVAVVPLTLVSALALAGCSSPDPSEAGETGSARSSSTASSESAEATPEAAEVPDLTGSWKQSNSGSEDAYQAATISGDTISINWVSDGGDTESVYWVGTFTPPADGTSPYTWTSARDAAATDSALLASMDDTKEFTVEDGELSYKASLMGTTTTVRLEKE